MTGFKNPLLVVLQVPLHTIVVNTTDVVFVEDGLVLVVSVNTTHPVDELWINDMPADSPFLACQNNPLQNPEQVVLVGAVDFVRLDDGLYTFIALP